MNARSSFTGPLNWSPGAQYSLAVGVALAGLGLRWSLDDLFGGGVPFLLAFAVLLPLLPLVRPGAFLAAGTICWLGGWYVFSEPRGSFALEGSVAVVRVASFGLAVAAATLASWMASGVAAATFGAQDALRESEARFRRMADDAPVMVWITGPDGRCTFLSESWYRFTGQTPETGLGFGWLDAVHPDDREASEGAFKSATAAASSFRIDYRLRRHDGEYLWAIDSAKPRLGARGEFLGFIGSVLDISDRKAAEEALRLGEQRLQLAKAAAGLGIHDYDVVRDRIEWDERTRALWGVEPGEVITYETFEGGLHPDDRAQSAADVASALRPGSSGDYRSRYRVGHRVDGRVRWVQAMGKVTFASGRPVRLVGTVQDVTEQHEAAEALRRSEERYRSLFTTMEAGFCVVDVLIDEAGKPVDYRFIEANPAFERQTGLRDAIGRTARELVPDLEARWFEVYGRVALTGEAVRFVDEAQAMDGRWFDVYASRLGGDESRRVAILFTDISARKQAEQALRESEARYRQTAELLQDADRRKDEFLATLAHELRNPLAPIRMAVPILRLSREDPVRFEHTVGAIERQSAQLVRLIDDLLDVSRITQGKIGLRPERVDLASAVSAAVETARGTFESRQVRLTVDRPGVPIPLDADPARLAQVIGNLLSNAAKFTPPGGEVQVTVWRDGAMGAVRVRDSGIGIPTHQVPHVFEMFTQLDGAAELAPGGLGIGLSLARSLVELHGGRLDAHSEGPGTGSTFIVQLPIASADEVRAAAGVNAPARREAAIARRILVVDDNEDVLDTLTALLRLEGHEVRTAASGPEALAVADASPPDVLLLDIGMPGLDGYEVARRVRRRTWGAGVLLIAMTGWGQQKDKDRAAAAGFDAHLTKPADLDALQQLLESR